MTRTLRLIRWITPSNGGRRLAAGLAYPSRRLGYIFHSEDELVLLQDGNDAAY